MGLIRAEVFINQHKPYLNSQAVKYASTGQYGDLYPSTDLSAKRKPFSIQKSLSTDIDLISILSVSTEISTGSISILKYEDRPYQSSTGSLRRSLPALYQSSQRSLPALHQSSIGQHEDLYEAHLNPLNPLPIKTRSNTSLPAKATINYTASLPAKLKLSTLVLV